AGTGEPMDIVGDSAGGNLALCWALRRKKGDRLILLSPWLDLRVDGPSARRNESRHSAFDREDLREYAGLYLAGKAPTAPDCSPLLASTEALQTLGPILLEHSDNELLAEDSVAFATTCRTAGLDITHAIEPDAPHGWQLFPDLLPEAKRSIERMRDFLAQP
ncbi:MAG: alpha/beta hydrolase fold domain-containing protein, partial [Bacteroidota bacterium]|nr:alpha/beta hydrolase fold domain-containing protein [Bacteroidota bacterium]